MRTSPQQPRTVAKVISVVISGLALIALVWLSFNRAISAIPYTAAHRSAATVTMAARIEHERDEMRQRLATITASDYITIERHTNPGNIYVMSRETPGMVVLMPTATSTPVPK